MIELTVIADRLTVIEHRVEWPCHFAPACHSHPLGSAVFRSCFLYVDRSSCNGVLFPGLCQRVSGNLYCHVGNDEHTALYSICYVVIVTPFVICKQTCWAFRYDVPQMQNGRETTRFFVRGPGLHMHGLHNDRARHHWQPTQERSDKP